MNMLKITSIILILLSLAACANTIRGVGRDVRDSADAVADSVS